MKKWLTLMLLSLVPGAQAALPPGISGSWYNPAQSGHGVTVEVLDETRALAGWYVYDQAGNPINLYLEGVIEGTSIKSQAYLARGMRFGSFQPSDLRIQPWGQVTLTFSSCDNATLRWNADGVAGMGYGSGEMPLTRLTRIAGLDCRFPPTMPQAVLPAGTYSGTWDRAYAGYGSRPWPLHVAVDTRGRLWAATDWSAGATYISIAPLPPSFFGSAAQPLGSGATMQVTALSANGLVPYFSSRSAVVPATFTIGADGSVSASEIVEDEPYLVERFSFAHDPAAIDTMRQPAFDPASLVGRTFRFAAQGQFFAFPYDIRFLPGQRFCLDLDPTGCRFSGQVGAVDPGLAMFDIEIVDTTRTDPPFVGKGWLTGTPQRLVIVTHNGTTALSTAATER